MYLIDRFLSAKMGHPVFNADAGAADARTYTHRQPQIGERKRLLFPQRLSNLFRCLFHNSTVYGSKRFVPFSDNKDNRNFSFIKIFLIGFSYTFGGKYQRSTYFVLNALFSTANLDLRREIVLNVHKDFFTPVRRTSEAFRRPSKASIIPKSTRKWAKLF